MALPITLATLSSLTNETSALAQINSNFSTIQTALTEALALNGQSPNQMQSTLDMNSNTIINLGAPLSNSSPLRVSDITLVNGAVQYTGANFANVAFTGLFSSLSGSISSPSITGTISGNPTITAPTITNPSITGTISGGPTISAPTITAPTITGPSITGTISGNPTITAPTITGPSITGTISGNPTITAPVISGGTLSGTLTASGATLNSPSIVTPTNTNPTYTGCTTTSPTMTLDAGTLQTSATAGAIEYDGTVFYATPFASARASLLASHYCIQTASKTLSNATGNQTIFNATTNGAITLPASTWYFIEGFYQFRTTGTTSHQWGIIWGGTATFNSFAAGLSVNATSTAVAGVAITSPGINTAVTLATTTADTVNIYFTGIMQTNASGTFIPYVDLSAAPGGTSYVSAGSWIMLTPFVNPAVGNWS